VAAKKTTTKKKKARASKSTVVPPDLRDPLSPTPAQLEATLANVTKAIEGLPAPKEPLPGDLVDAMLHITFAEGLPCGIGQECLRRFHAHFVDRNEFRLTESYEIEEVFADLGIPDLFERSERARDTIAEIYNDQNQITLDFLREASVSDRTLFFQRVPAMAPAVQHFLQGMLNFEEVIFSPRSTLRVQQRLGFEPKDKHIAAFLERLGEILRPFGHLPLAIAGGKGDGKPVLTPALSAASEVIRLSPPLKGSKSR
jgi:hypothetical protein